MWHASSASSTFDAMLVLVRVERLQHADRERARRTEPGAGGDVGHRRDLDAGAITDVSTRISRSSAVLDVDRIGDPLDAAST